MIEGALTLPPDVRNRLILALKSGQVREPLSKMSLLRVLSDSELADQALRWLKSLAEQGVNLAGAAYALECVGASEQRVAEPVLVWSGPEVMGVHSRDTRRVFEELFGAATRTLWVSTYAIWDGSAMFEKVARRMEQVPELEVTILLNLMNARQLEGNEAVLKFSRQFWRQWPGPRRPRVFYDARALESGKEKAVLHAKGVVQDDEAALVTSANLTEAAFDRNIELGVLLRDRVTCQSIVRHFQRSIEERLLSPLP